VATYVNEVVDFIPTVQLLWRLCDCRRLFISPPGSDSFRSGLMFHCRCLFFICSPWYLRVLSADRRKILHRGPYWAEF